MCLYCATGSKGGRLRGSLDEEAGLEGRKKQTIVKPGDIFDF